MNKGQPSPYPQQAGFVDPGGFAQQGSYPQQAPHFQPQPTGQGPYPQGMYVAYPSQPPYNAQMPYPQQPTYYPPPQEQFRGGMAYTAGGYDSDAEGGHQPQGDMAGAFSDKAVRRGFIKKVYGILLVQLLVTGAIVALFTFVQDVRFWAKRNSWLYILALVMLVVCMIVLACCEGVRRKAPMNYIVLGIFTLLEGFVLGVICARFDADAVLIAVGACAAVSLALTLFAFQTKWDFTACGGMMCALFVVLFVCGIVMIFVPYNKYAMIGYGALGALVFSLYIVYDTQLMMGGKHKYTLDPEEYVFASLSLYLDIINLFVYILMIVGAARSD